MKHITMEIFLKTSFTMIGIASGIVSILLSTIIILIFNQFGILNSKRFFWIIVMCWSITTGVLYLSYDKIEKKLRKYYYYHKYKAN